MKKKRFYLLIFVVFTTFSLTAQVAINKDGSNANPNSILHVKGSGVNALLIDYSDGFIGVNNIHPSYRLHLLETLTDTKNYGSVFEITGGSTDTEKYSGVYSYINGSGGVNRAFEGLSYGNNANSYNVGFGGFAKNAKYNYALQGQSVEANNISNGNNIGAVTEASNCNNLNIGLWSIGHGTGNYNIGVWAESVEANPGVNYGIYATAVNSGPGAGNSWAAYFTGKINVDGSIYQNGSVLHSKSVFAIDNASDKVMAFKPISYIDDNNELLYGFDVEAMKETLPEIVKEVTLPVKPGSENGEVIINSSVNVSAMISIMTKALQELNEKVENLEVENALLKKEISGLK